MKRALLIAEKPSVMRDIQQVYNQINFPDEIEFTALVGHIMELKEPAEYKQEWGKPWRLDVLPMFPDKFEFDVIKGKNKASDRTDVYKELKRKLKSKKYDYVINACDAGREGELIFNAFYEHVGAPYPVKRFWASDPTFETTKEALFNLIDSESIDIQRLNISSKFRAYFDWLLGMNLSRAAMLKTKQMFPIGRVMTPTLNIVVQRELEIRNFKPTPFYEIEGEFGDYKGIWYNKDTNERRIMDKKEAENLQAKLSEESEAEVASVEKKKQSRKAPTLHSLLELQKEANRAFGYSAQQTLDIAQFLYENAKLISYPRTESRYLPKNLAQKIKNNLFALKDIPTYGNVAEQILNDQQRISKTMNDKSYVDDKKVTDHYAIIPTTTKPNLNSLTPEQRNIYLLVVKRFLAIFMDPCQTYKTTIVTNAGGEMFKTTGTTVIDLGFMKLYQSKNKKKEDTLPKVAKGDSVPVTKITILEKETSPPKRYTDSSLLEAMANAGRFVEDKDLQAVLRESAGLGTSATRAGIFEKLERLKLIGRKGKNFYATEFGIEMIEKLEGQDIISPKLTAEWESKLLGIEEGTYESDKFYKEMLSYTSKTTKDLIENLKADFKHAPSKRGENNKANNVMKQKCPACESKVVVGKKYYLCQNYGKTCKVIIPKEFGRAKITKTEAEKLLAGKPSKEFNFEWDSGSKTKGRLILNKEHKLSFYNGNIDADKEEKVGTCPNCSGDVVDKGFAFVCKEKSCNFRLSKKVKGANLTKTDAKKMLGGKKTAAKKFTWSNGKTGKAKLYLQGVSLRFEFVND